MNAITIALFLTRIFACCLTERPTNTKGNAFASSSSRVPQNPVPGQKEKAWIITLEEKHDLLSALEVGQVGKATKSYENGGLVLQLSADQLANLMSYPRDYNLVTLFSFHTNERPSNQCVAAERHFHAFAAAYHKSYGNSSNDALKFPVIFSIVNYFKGGQDAFKGLQISRPPACSFVSHDALQPYKIEYVVLPLHCLLIVGH